MLSPYCFYPPAVTPQLCGVVCEFSCQHFFFTLELEPRASSATCAWLEGEKEKKRWEGANPSLRGKRLSWWCGSHRSHRSCFELTHLSLVFFVPIISEGTQPNTPSLLSGFPSSFKPSVFCFFLRDPRKFCSAQKPQGNRNYAAPNWVRR